MATSSTRQLNLRGRARNFGARGRDLRFLLLALAGALAVFAALRIFGRVDRFVLVWPVSGMEVALLLPFWQRRPSERAWSLIAIGLGVYLGGLSVGMPWWFAVQIALLTCLDCFLACTALGSHVQQLDHLKQTRNVLRFGVVATFVPILTGLLGAIPVSAFLHRPLFITAGLSALANSLGFALALPLFLFLISGDHREVLQALRHRPAASLAFLLLLACTSLVFWQTVRPFLFVVFPPLIAVVVLFGLEGSLFASLALMIIGWIATSHHHGPIWLTRTASDDERLVTLQFFVWIVVATALPIGAIADERRRAQRDLVKASSIYEILLEHAPDMIVLSSLDGEQRFVSRAVQDLTGWTPDQYLALHRFATFHPDDRAIAESVITGLDQGRREQLIRYRIMRKNGDSRWVEATIRAYGDVNAGEIDGYVATIRDISSLRETEADWQQERAQLADENRRVANLANTDPLTGLLNRRGFDEAVAGQPYPRRKDRVALLMLDVDFFKLYNDTLGHPQGDECLRMLAAAFSRRVGREGDLVARFGGEEFGILLRRIELDDARSVAEGILQSVRALNLEHKASPLGVVTLSAGIAVSGPLETHDLKQMILDADRALYRSKQSGRNRISIAEA